MSFEKGITYHWNEIIAQLDAETTPPPYALHRNGHVVGFALNIWQNPKAPYEVLVGYGNERQKYADKFISELPVVPVLIRQNKTDSVWRCAGHFKLEKVSEEILDKNKRVTPIDIPDIYKILFLAEVSA